MSDVQCDRIIAVMASPSVMQSLRTLPTADAPKIGFLPACFDGVAVYESPWLIDGSYVEKYASGKMIVRAPEPPKPIRRWRHQRPLRNIKRRAQP